ncbi:hypothetical protein G3O08_17485 [Cryomorpha ignava]|uniref:Cytochrome c domain-containing protein n=1 Tax=Cryomorpha ignava TaxID=101383 RepID=A0A7K3WWJ3_9FLAO|nr:cytochrome c [Cryomorpha ignava]NEN25292.1 hypothetical protein [Cryomorpha ignava]
MKNNLTLFIVCFVMTNFFWNVAAAQDGKNLFDGQCGTCHNYAVQMIGPPITFISDYKSFDWFVDFTKDPISYNRTDKDEYTRLMLDHYLPFYGVHPPVKLTDEELSLIWNFLIGLKTKTTEDLETDSLRKSWVK